MEVSGFFITCPVSEASVLLNFSAARVSTKYILSKVELWPGGKGMPLIGKRIRR
jgi:hypothetical protein